MASPFVTRPGDIILNITLQPLPLWTEAAAARETWLMAHLTIRVDLDREVAFGPGKARLLELIDEKGSLRSAALAMDMSYRRAWLLLRETEAMMRAPVVASRTGGPKGGGTALTPFGRGVVKSYRAIEARAEDSASAEVRALVRMVRRGAVLTNMRRKKMTKTKRAGATTARKSQTDF
jgi:molybdate transport system regulatory protein